MKSNTVGIAGGSGGQSVALADAFAEADMKVPRLTKESYDEFATFFSVIGGGYNNPIDTGNPNRSQMRRIMDILDRDANVDNLMLIINALFRGVDEIEANIGVALDVKKTSAKPFAVTFSFYAPDREELVKNGTERLLKAGIPVFPSIERGAVAMRNAWRYYSSKNDITY
jgi:acyl-CoA synthetase (NDP forming)